MTLSKRMVFIVAAAALMFFAGLATQGIDAADAAAPDKAIPPIETLGSTWS